MDMQSIIYLLELVSKMVPSGHTRQSLYLASLLTRITWSAESSSDGGQSVAHANSPIQATLSASKCLTRENALRENDKGFVFWMSPDLHVSLYRTITSELSKLFVAKVVQNY